MRNLSTEEFQRIVEAGHETRNIEFKPAFLWDDPQVWLREKVIQTILGMTNTRDGGTIVIGVTEDNGVPDLSTGLLPTQRASFDRYDDIKGVVDGFATGVGFEMASAEHNGRTFIVIAVREFELTPAICKKNGQDHGGKPLLRVGDVYARALHGHESTIRATDSEMREIIELAVDKAQRNLIGRGWSFDTEAPDQFKKQRGDF